VVDPGGNGRFDQVGEDGHRRSRNLPLDLHRPLWLRQLLDLPPFDARPFAPPGH
jgi:hypothetical protein